MRPWPLFKVRRSHGGSLKAVPLRPMEKVPKVIIQLALVFLYRQHVVRTGVHNLLRYLPLTSHSVNGHDAPPKRQQFQQPGNSGDLTGLLLGLDLAQGDLAQGDLAQGPGAHQVDGPPALGAVVGASHRLTVNGHRFPLDQLGHLAGPVHKAALELLGVQTGEHLAEGVVGRDAPRQFQEGPEPLLPAPSEHLDMHPGINAADGGANGYGYDVQQFVPLASFEPGSSKEAKQSRIVGPSPFAVTTSLHPPG